MTDGIDPRISLRRLEVFVLVVEQGGVTRAAERLMVAQPAVSAQLRTLEESMGAALFVRTKNALVPTEAGDRVYRWAKEVLAGGAQLRRDVVELAAGHAGTVTVTSSMRVGTYLLPPLLIRLRAERALRSVELGEADFTVLTWVDDAVPAGLHAERLWDEPVVLCASPDGPPAGDTVEPAGLSALTTVGSPPEVALQQTIQRQLRALGGELHIGIHLGHAEAMKRAVLELGAVSFLPRYAVRDELESGRLREVVVAGVRLTETIGLYHRDTTPLLAPAAGGGGHRARRGSVTTSVGDRRAHARRGPGGGVDRHHGPARRVGAARRSPAFGPGAARRPGRRSSVRRAGRNCGGPSRRRTGLSPTAQAGTSTGASRGPPVPRTRTGRPSIGAAAAASTSVGPDRPSST